MNSVLAQALAKLPPTARILDAGGWFRPCAAATDVVDKFPYETRGGALQLSPQPGERFSKATWRQVDFLDPALRLPYPDLAFDFSICTQTIEDLVDPEPLLRELRRVSRAGYIECPSRLSEQTVGVRDRTGSLPGHPHHHWIVDATGPLLELAPKQSSLAGPSSLHTVPLRYFERRVAHDASLWTTSHLWQGELCWRLVPDSEAALRARNFVSQLLVSTLDRGFDPSVRHLRRLKYRLKGHAEKPAAEHWRELVDLSRPYSEIPL